MEERISQIAVIIGASPLAEELRRTLVRTGVPHAGVSTNLRGLRRSLALGESSAAVLCIALDRTTLDRLGVELRTLLADYQGFGTDVRTVGLLSETGLTDEIVGLGCDLYVDDSALAAHVVDLLAAVPVQVSTGVAEGSTSYDEPGECDSTGFETRMFGEARLSGAVTGRLANRRFDMWKSVDDPATGQNGT